MSRIVEEESLDKAKSSALNDRMLEAGGKSPDKSSRGLSRDRERSLGALPSAAASKTSDSGRRRSRSGSGGGSLDLHFGTFKQSQASEDSTHSESKERSPKQEDANVNHMQDIQSYMVLGTRFDIDERYSIINSIGQGAYGVVCAARDERLNKVVAIKKIERAFEHHTFSKRTLRELILLRQLQHENIIRLSSILQPLDSGGFDEIYCVFELMETDLASIIKSPQPLSEEHCQFFLYQILRGLKYIHSRNVIHRDLKPRNLLVNSNCDLKICDFGLARVDFPNLQGRTAAMTDYVATRWYRAPEIILTWEKYSKAIDMWSVGCIFAELMGRQPLFPGIDSQNQVQLIVDVLGYPDESVLSKIRSEKAKKYLERLPRGKGANLGVIFPDSTDTSRDLLKNLLCFDPETRFDVNAAIQHPYLDSLHYMEDEPTGEPLQKLDFDFEYHFLTSNEYRELLLGEIRHYAGDAKGSNSSARK